MILCDTVKKKCILEGGDVEYRYVESKDGWIASYADAKAALDAQAAEITRLRAVSDEVRGYLSRLLQSLHPAIDLLPNVLGVCTQIDHVLGGQREEITRLRAVIERLAQWHDAHAAHYEDEERKFNALPDGMSIAANFAQAKFQHKQRAAEIRAAAGEGKP